MEVTPRERQISKEYMKEFFVAMLAYVIVIIGAFSLIARTDVAWQRWLLALLPMIPLLFALRALIRYLHRIDEYQQRIQYNSFAVSAAATAFVTFTLGLLENVGMPQLSMVWVLPMICFFWMIANIWQTWWHK